MPCPQPVVERLEHELQDRALSDGKSEQRGRRLIDRDPNLLDGVERHRGARRHTGGDRSQDADELGGRGDANEYLLVAHPAMLPGARTRAGGGFLPSERGYRFATMREGGRDA